ncbi:MULTISPECIES: cytochrome C oxidase subunit IV family protein [Psychroflexus]|jgi:heme/copper-type cytochrome/quinol oxidase subunit 4|uniref:Cytochrome C oxidase subunit IV family protein n=2 Tax=Psychroflexus TaxID=83612 RepID=A0ABN1K0H8_9FLAO|nr:MULTISPECIES: cytochrome C oxidase subunit IV family protein [Psychroflexus]MBZ9620926.1 cytochrome C oxidase subunit IV family protein [Psychroflexus lacisalsi]MBZ9777875.1 cytochrome C oxidase subunit IV family protein [Psychroflexus longus]
MAHDTTHGEHSGAKKRIWQVFIILSILTIVEVVLGIFKPDFLVHTDLVSLSLLNWIFIVLTIIKAYYIVWAFMHMEHEAASLRRVVVWTGVFLISYLIAILLIEGTYIQEIYESGYITWDF